MQLHNKLQKDYTLNQSGYQLKLPLENCKRDINFIFLLEGHSAPDHATLARFRSIHFAPCSKHILAEVSRFEANANKYTFVWKKAVTKNQAKLLIKLADFVAECEQLYDIKIVYGNVVKIKHLKRLRKKLYALKNAGNITFVHGIGKRKTPLQKSIEALEEALSKLKEYTQ
ncbi:hypothetical protein [Eubacterium sp. LMAG:50]|uniref:hypothetical protein n=1 Tax=Eubacterium sp. LMAG:50 TaxID=1969563 RepID=UPI00341E9E7F